MEIETPKWNDLTDPQKNQIESDIENYKAKNEWKEKLKIPFPPDSGQGLGNTAPNMQGGLAFWERIEVEDKFDYKLYDIQ